MAGVLFAYTCLLPSSQLQMNGGITRSIDCGDDVFNQRNMTKTELTLDELKAVSGVRGGRTRYIRAGFAGAEAMRTIPQFRLRVESFAGPGETSFLCTRINPVLLDVQAGPHRQRRSRGDI